MNLRILLSLLFCLTASAATPWTIYQNSTSGVTMTESASEIFGFFPSTTTFHYVADVQIGGRMRRSDGFTNTFKLLLNGDPAFDGTSRVGYFEAEGGSSAATYHCGLQIMSHFSAQPTTYRVYASMGYQGAVITSSALSLETNTVYDMGVVWTPTGGTYGYGRMTVSATNASLQVFTATLDPQNNNIGWSGTAWGIWQGYTTADTETIAITVTDPVYTQFAYPDALPSSMDVYGGPVGQSNARGNNGSRTNLISVSPYSATNTYQYINGRWAFLHPGDPLHNDFGPQFTMGAALAGDLGNAVGFIPRAIGGRSLGEEFLPENGLSYTWITNNVPIALAQLTSPNLRAFIFVQGETDAGSDNLATNYYKNFTNVMGSLRRDLNKPSLYHIHVRLPSWANVNATRRDIIRAAQMQAGNWVNTDDFESMGDGLHYSGNDQITNGYRMARKELDIRFGTAALSFTGQRNLTFLGAPADLVTRIPEGHAPVALTNHGGFFYYDPNALVPTNTTDLFRPNGKFGRWVPWSPVAGVSVEQLKQVANLQSDLETLQDNIDLQTPLTTAAAYRLDASAEAMAGRRPGLQFNRVSGSRVTTGLNPAAGTNDFSIIVRPLVPRSMTSGSAGRMGIAAAAGSATESTGAAGDWQLFLESDDLVFRIRNATGGRTATVDDFIGQFGGKVVSIGIARSYTNLTITANGRALTYSEATEGTSHPSDFSGDFSGIYLHVGLRSSADVFQGPIYAFSYYNRRLTTNEFSTAATLGVEYADQWASQTELSSGTFTIGKRYRITARTDGDFTTVGASANTVGVEFVATGTGAGILDAGDKALPIGALIHHRYDRFANGFIYDLTSNNTKGTNFTAVASYPANLPMPPSFTLSGLTRAQRDALSPINGMIIYQTDSTPGLRFYENGAWVRPTVTADP